MMDEFDFEKLNIQLKNVSTKLLSDKSVLNEKKIRKVMTFGTFDLFHIGHENIINHCINLVGDESNVYIGVSSDNWNKLKGKDSSKNQEQRINEILEKYPKANVFLEDHNFPEESWPELFDQYKIDIIVMGGDHLINLNYINNIFTSSGKKMRIIFYERTPKISSTLIKKYENQS